MIDELRSIAIFAEAIKLGSFRAAAKSLGLSPSVVSYQISQLEKKLDTALIYRSTRHLSLSHEGEVLYQYALKMMATAHEAVDQITNDSSVLKGQLSITLPSALIHSQITKHIAEFKTKHPELKMTLNYDDDQQDIIDGGFDLAIRAGVLADSELKSRSIGFIKRTLVCAPQYYRIKGTPNHITDLSEWDWIGLDMLANQREFTALNGNSLIIKYTSTTTVNSVVAMTQLCKEGVGVATPPHELVKQEIDNGKLIHLCPDWEVNPIPLHAIWPNNVSLKSNAKSLINYLVEKSMI